MKLKVHKGRLILYFGVLVLSIVFASFYGGPVSYLWLHAMMLLLPLSFFYLFLNYFFLRIYQEVDVIKLTKGETHTYSAVLENVSILPLHKMKLHLYTDRCRLFDMEDEMTVSLNTLERKELSSGIRCMYAGAYYVGIKAITLSDAFHIMDVTMDIPWNFRAIVRPQISDMAASALDIENLRNNTGFKSENKFEEIPGNDMRSYIPGDPLHSINWKISAKFSKLVVRLPEKMEKKTVTLLLFASKAPKDTQDIEFLKKRDSFLEFMISAAWYFSDQGIPLRVLYPSGDIIEKTILTYNDFTEFYDTVTDHIFYGSDSVYEKMQSLSFTQGEQRNESDTWIVIEEDSIQSEDFLRIYN